MTKLLIAASDRVAAFMSKRRCDGFLDHDRLIKFDDAATKIYFAANQCM